MLEGGPVGAQKPAGGVQDTPARGPFFPAPGVFVVKELEFSTGVAPTGFLLALYLAGVLEVPDVQVDQEDGPKPVLVTHKEFSFLLHAFLELPEPVERGGLPILGELDVPLQGASFLILYGPVVVGVSGGYSPSFWGVHTILVFRKRK